MTPDDVIAMHKACERVIEEVSLLGADGPLTPREADFARQITALATVQRDLLKGLLGG